MDTCCHTDSRTLSDFSDYDSSEEGWRATHSRQQSRNTYPSGSRNAFDAVGGTGHPDPTSYASLDDEGAGHNLMDPNDPFGDPFADENETHTQGFDTKRRMEWAEI